MRTKVRNARRAAAFGVPGATPARATNSPVRSRALYAAAGRLLGRVVKVLDAENPPSGSEDGETSRTENLCWHRGRQQRATIRRHYNNSLLSGGAGCPPQAEPSLHPPAADCAPPPGRQRNAWLRASQHRRLRALWADKVLIYLYPNPDAPESELSCYASLLTLSPAASSCAPRAALCEKRRNDKRNNGAVCPWPAARRGAVGRAPAGLRASHCFGGNRVRS